MYMCLDIISSLFGDRIPNQREREEREEREKVRERESNRESTQSTEKLFLQVNETRAVCVV